MPIEFANPIGLGLLGLLAPLIALYILKVRRQRVQVASTWLWQAARRDLIAEQPFRRLIPHVPLLLEIAILVFLSLALAQPMWVGGPRLGQHVAIVLDGSASMQATDENGQVRFELAKRAASEIIDALEPGSDVLLILASNQARIVTPPDRDRRRLKLELNKLAASATRGRLVEGIALARDRLRTLPGNTSLVVISDSAEAIEEGDSPRVPLRVVSVGTPADNTALLQINAAWQGQTLEVFAVVANFGTAPRDVYVTLRQQNVQELLASKRLELAANERTPITLRFEAAAADAGTGLILELSGEDALGVDDRMFVIAPKRKQLPVVLTPVTKFPWLERALLADENVELYSLEEGGDASSVPRDALVFVHGRCQADLPSGDLVIVEPPEGRCLTSRVGASFETTQVTSWADFDPRFRFMNLADVRVRSGRMLTPDDPNSVLLNSRAGPLMTRADGFGRSVSIFGFSFGNSNWPLKASFVIFARNLVEQARERRSQNATATLLAGHTYRAVVPPDVSRVELVEPDGTERALEAHLGQLATPPLEQAGFYFLSWQGDQPGSLLIATNLADEVESNLRAQAPPSSTGASKASLRPLDVDKTNWGFVAALVALVVFVFEIWWLTRRAKAAPLAAPRRNVGARLP